MAGAFTVCIVGRPNVGKSTLFNKLTGTRRSIVDNYAGVTRDRLLGQADLEGRNAILIDTGGLEFSPEDEISVQVREQALLAVEEADVICFTVDGRQGLTPIDRDIAEMLRKSGKRVVVAANKIDTPRNDFNLSEFYELGLDEVIAVSAEHSVGLGDLAEALVEGREMDPEEEEGEDVEKPVTVAIVGRPNVGKSSLLNKIMGEDRMMVSDIPGTTRESIDSVVQWHNKEFIFIDTAGMRKKNRIVQKLEKFSVIMALKAISRCQVALLIIDAKRGIGDQESKIAGIIRDEAKACIIVVNKWDLAEKDSQSTKVYTDNLREELKFLSFAPVIFVSAVTGQRTGQIFEVIQDVMKEYGKRVDTGPLNRNIIKWVDRKSPPIVDGKRAKFYYVTQTKSAPPIFNFSVNSPERIPEHYQRYLVNNIRKEYGFDGSPVVCRFQPRKGRR